MPNPKDVLTPCTPLDLLHICRLLQIPLSAVEEKHTAIMEMVKSGEFQARYKYHKSIHRTLIVWLQMAIDRGYIQRDYNILDETHRQKFERLEREAIAHGLL